MGVRIKLKCNKCGKKTDFKEGGGRDPLYYAQNLYKRIMRYKKYAILKDDLKEHPGCLPNPVWRVYACRCGYWKSEESMDVVRFVKKTLPAEDGMEEFEYLDYELIKRKYKTCPRCRKRMKRFRRYVLSDEQVISLGCPGCGGQTEITEYTMWD